MHFDGTVTLTKKDGKIDTDFDDITLNGICETQEYNNGKAGLRPLRMGGNHPCTI